jgi:hypothetical protein
MLMNTAVRGVVADVISLGYRLHCSDVEVAVSFANEGDL